MWKPDELAKDCYSDENQSLGDNIDLVFAGFIDCVAAALEIIGLLRIFFFVINRFGVFTGDLGPGLGGLYACHGRDLAVLRAWIGKIIMSFPFIVHKTVKGNDFFVYLAPM